MSLWQRIQNALESGVNQRVTRVGLLYTLACTLVALAAISSANNLLFLILAAMLATFMMSGLVSHLSLAGLALDLILPEHISARRKQIGRLVIQNEKRWMSSFSIHLTGTGQNAIAPIHFAIIPSGTRLEHPVEIYFERRGSYRENSFRFSTRFPFGFAERRMNVILRREVTVYPCIDPQPGFEDLLAELNGEIESMYRGQGSDFYRIRPYEALESARHVDWKATAHTGDLQVREFAREEERSVAFFLDLNVPHEQEEWFEHAVDCCAYLAYHMADRGGRFRMCTQHVDLYLPEDGDVYTILKYLATVAPAGSKKLPSPSDRNVFQIVFSLWPERLSEAGWILSGSNVRVLGVEELKNADRPNSAI
jgi:uncharacterized protein (DUF58 family)